MRNVLKILKRDLLRLLKTPQALVVVFALMVIPSLYTWYNVVGFWNPYDNTGNLTVCVVNQDAGGSSELTGELNVGERIVDQLHENNQLHWEFTDYDAAMNELKGGRAYAAYVIPEHFTADLLTITTGSFTQPKIEYYVNEKSGPVAPKITDTGATTLDETINSTFVATVSDVVVKTIDEKVNEGRESTKEMQSKAAQKISEAVAATGEVRRVLADLGDASKAAKDKAASAKETLSKASAGIDAADESLGQMGETATTMQKTLSDFSAFVLPAVTAGLDDITQASNDATSAAARLTAINEHQDLGSGMRIAMRDLEIRGAGSMLGAEQSGNMSAVGFDLFAQMLNQAVNETREGVGASGELPPALSDITVNIPGHAYLPEEYIPDADARVLWYRKLASASTVEEVAALREDMLAKAPEMPEAAANLFERAWLKAFANEHGVKLISVAAGKLIVEPIDIPAAAMKPLRRAAGRYQTDKRKLTLPLRYFSEEERDTLLPAIVHFLEKLFGETDAEEGAPFAEMEGGASGSASDPASSVPRGIATDPAAGVSKNARTGSAKAVSQNAPTDSRRGGPRSALGQDPAKGSASAAPAPTRPTGRSERRANNLAKGDAARERLAAKRAARAAKREEGR